MTRSRRVLLGMAVHPPQLAATRLRLTQYFPYFEEAGFDCQLWTFLSDRDLKRWHGSSTLARIAVTLRALLRVPRALMMLRRSDVIVVQRECLPFGPPVIEWFAARSGVLIWDVDDFIWERYVSPTAGRWTTWLRTSEKKNDRICRWATECWAGSDAIVGWMRHRTDAVHLVPSVIAVPENRPVLRGRDSTAVWVGSHSTAAFLDQVMPALSKCENLDAVVVVGGNLADRWPVVVSERQWSEEMEQLVCASARVGLYPVDRSNVYAEGKCGLKAVVYMAHGLPCVVTPTSPNAAVVRHEIDGLHAKTLDEWTDAVERLLKDDLLWDRLSSAGYRRALDSYSLQTWGPRVAGRVRWNADQPGIIS